MSFASFCLIVNELVGGEGGRTGEREGEKGRGRESECVQPARGYVYTCSMRMCMPIA